MKDAGKQFLIDVLALDKLPGMVEMYELAGIFDKADQMLDAITLGSIEGFASTLMDHPIKIDFQNKDQYDGAVKAVEAMGEAVDMYLARAREAFSV